MDEHNDKGVDYALLGRFLSGEATVAEREAVAAWLAESEDNQQVLNDLERLWEASEQSGAPRPDRQAAWQKVRERTLDQGGGAVRPFRISRIWYAAAGVLLLAVLFLFIRYQAGQGAAGEGGTLYTATEKALDLRLPDGSEVRLEPGSSLTLVEDFGQAHRKVHLSPEGNAYFKVAKDSTLPFVVSSSNVKVQVLGTAFRLRETDQGADLQVDEGRVRFARVDSIAEHLEVTAGERARFDAREKVVRRYETTDSAYWQSRNLHFSGTPLSEVVAQVNRIFDAEVSLDRDALGDCPLTADFDDPTLESMLQVVSATFNLEMQHAQSRIILSGEGCD